MTAKSCFVKTSDWWCGNYYADGTTFYQRHGMNAVRSPHFDESDPKTWGGEEYVKLTLSKSLAKEDPEDCFVQVAAWGNDDLGLVKDFPLSQAEEAEQLYQELSAAEDLTRQLLLRHGFDYF